VTRGRRWGECLKQLLALYIAVQEQIGLSQLACNEARVAVGRETYSYMARIKQDDSLSPGPL